MDDLDGQDDFGPDDDLSPEDLKAQLAAERAARKAEREAYERDQSRLDSFLRGVREPQEPAPTQRRAPLGPMPDPNVDFEAYQRWMAEKDARLQAELDARLERERTEMTQQMTQNQWINQLWTRFSDKYPAYAERSSLIRTAYIDLTSENALPQDLERAAAKIKERVDQMVGAPLDQIRQPADRTETMTPPGPTPVQRRRAKPEDEILTTHDSITKQKIKYGLI